jgi:hypothetical protein
MRVEYTGRQKMQGEFAFVGVNGVSCVGPSLVTNNDIGIGSEKIGHFALALIAPVSADNRFDHKKSLL